ncbi:glyoxylate reductase [Desulfacinum hydrothermale DSM 13146]|uniref:Glyoxylate reductase n=1 Tax=Desulfacinum hydrothermale DSM 13146 TaxID=1121390 RepID=A0A1W1XND1_9BACT|nr:D-glycerate dehydrogenase [Desulfacinum hydrothermale]SMC25008.1 glyoxylate reductase [Desulfacinum hydrothermale DSM 13146]
MKVLVTARLPEAVVGKIREAGHEVDMHLHMAPLERDQLLNRMEGVAGLLSTITDRIDGEVFDRAPGLRVVANYGVGFDHIDVAEATRRGILVTNTPGVLTDATADLTFALILAVARRVVEGDHRTRSGKFQFWAPLHFLGTEVSGKTLGIVGLGRIGRAVARRARGFDMQVLYTARKPLGRDEEERLGVRFAPLDQLLARSDFVSLHVPLTPETHHLIGARELSLMKPFAYLINTARGPVVDETALLEALRQRRIGGAGLDVYENEPQLTPGLADLQNVVLLPHVGSATVETRTRMAQMAVENLLAGLSGHRPPHGLNWEAVQGKRGKGR